MNKPLRYADARLRKNYQFNYVYKNGKCVSNEVCKVVFCKNKSGKLKVGFSVSKKFGKAVKRNRAKRRIKEVVGSFLTRLDAKNNYVFLPKEAALDAKFSDMKESMEKLLVKAGLLA